MSVPTNLMKIGTSNLPAALVSLVKISEIHMRSKQKSGKLNNVRIARRKSDAIDIRDFRRGLVEII